MDRSGRMLLIGRGFQNSPEQVGAFAVEVAAGGDEHPQIQLVDGEIAGDQVPRPQNAFQKSAVTVLVVADQVLDEYLGGLCGDQGDGVVEGEFDEPGDFGVVQRDVGQIEVEGKKVPVLEFVFDSVGGGCDSGLDGPEAWRVGAAGDGDEV